MTAGGPTPPGDRDPRRWRIVREGGFITLALFAPLYFFPVLFGGDTFYYRDLFKLYVPIRGELAAGLLSGDWPPLWTSLFHGGQPFLANLETASLYPGQVLYVLLPVLTALNLDIMLHTLAASLAAYALARYLGLGSPASLVVGLTYAYCGYSLSRINLLINHTSWPWLAIVLLLWLVYLDTGRRRWLGLTVLAGAVQVFAGCADEIAMTHVALLLVGVARHARGWRRGLGLGLGTSPAVALLAAVQLLPTLEMAAQSQRGAGMPHDVWTAWSVAPQRLPELLVPNYFGRVASMYESSYWGSPHVSLGLPYMNSLYLGLLVALLAGVGVLTRHRRLGFRLRAALAGVVGLSVILALGRHLPGFGLLYHLPGVSLFRFPVKALNLAILPLGLLAGAGLEACFEDLTRRARRGRWALWGAAAGSLLVLGLVASPIPLSALTGLPAELPAVRAEWISSLGRGAALVLLLALTVEAHRHRPRRGWIWAAAGLVLVDLGVAGLAVNPRAERDVVFQAPAATQLVRSVVGGGRLFRDRDPEVRLRPPSDDRVWTYVRYRELLSDYAATTQGIPMFAHDDFNGLAPTRAVLFQAVVGHLPWPLKTRLLGAASVTAVITSEPDPPPALVARGTIGRLGPHNIQLFANREAAPRVGFYSEWISAPDLQGAAHALQQADYDPRQRVVVEDVGHVPARCDTPAVVEARSTGPGAWEVELGTGCPGYLVFRDTHYPGWRTRVDGTERAAVAADLNFSAVHVDSGSHRITRRYEPGSARWGLVVSLTTLLLGGLGLARFRR